MMETVVIYVYYFRLILLGRTIFSESMRQVADGIKKKFLNLTIQKMRRQRPFLKLEAKKEKKCCSFLILPCYWNHSEEVVEQRRKEGKSFRLLNEDAGGIGSVDVYEISENRFRRAKCFTTTEVHHTCIWNEGRC
jgi:hypothetical protein